MALLTHVRYAFSQTSIKMVDYWIVFVLIMTLMRLLRLLHQHADVLQHHCGQRRRVVIVCRRTSCAAVRGVCLCSPIVCNYNYTGSHEQLQLFM